jgi:hypothetical protein
LVSLGLTKLIDFAGITGRLVLGVTPALLLGSYLLFGAVYCYRKGEVGFRSPASVTRQESFSRFICGVILIALCRAGFIALAVYTIARAIA